MKTNRYFSNFIAISLMAGMVISCASETPFETEGNGVVRMNVSMNSKVTRGDISDDVLRELEEKCVIYISDQKGLLHKWIGVSNIPPQLALKYDSYVAEAWSGDSVSASFDKKFYKGMTRFEVSANNQDQTVAINCKISNVIASVRTETINDELFESVSVTIWNTGKEGSLEFKDETINNTGYFMMPDEDTVLKYKAVVNGKDGSTITKDGQIENVIQGHHYILNFKTDPSEPTTGGAFFDIVIEEFKEEVNDEFIIYGKPAFSWSNPALTTDGQIVHLVEENDPFVTEILRVAAYNDGFEHLYLDTKGMVDSDNNKYFPSEDYDIVNIRNTDLENIGIDVLKKELPNDDGLYVWQIIFKDSFLNALQPKDTEYVMILTAIDKKGKSNSIKIRIANREKAIKYADPIVIDKSAFENDLTAVNAASASIPVTIADSSMDLWLQYRKKNESSWNSKKVEVLTRANQKVIVELTNLQENTTYEYRVAAGDNSETSEDFKSEIAEFKTESKFLIPNSSMEDWYIASDNAYVPMISSDESFWDNGNHGATQFLKDRNMTTPNTEYFHNGKTSACLASAFIAVKFAAGNLFVGKFLKTDGTKGADLTFGQPYNGSHPKSLKVFVNYRPGTVNYSEIGDLKKNETDHGQIFIALANAPSSLSTGKGIMFNPLADNILAYGEHTFAGNYGSDGQLDSIEIPIEYYEKAKTTKASYIIIVCSASKYGDYFTGSSSSVMYVDDFELVY